MIWSIGLAFFWLLSAKATIFHRYVEEGTNTLFTIPETIKAADKVSWYKGSLSDGNHSFSGQTLCIQETYFKSELQYSCIKNFFHLYNISKPYEGIYNAKVSDNSSTRNFYFNLTVIKAISIPICEFSSQFLTETYCLITINCTKNPLHTTIIYNHTQSPWVLNLKFSPRMPSQFLTQVTVSNISKQFGFHYPFHELCEIIEAEYEPDYFTYIALGVIVVCLCFVIGGCVYLYIQRKILLSLCSCGYKAEERIKISTLY
nr:E3 CR1-bate1 [Simian adenovirus GZ3-12]